MWAWTHKFGSPGYFYSFAGKLIPWLTVLYLMLFAIGLYLGLVKAPTDYQQGDSYRIIFVHVPSAWMSMFIYVVMAVFAAVGLIWRVKLTDVLATASAPLGASFTFLALATGSIWGKPMWGTWWVWDARLTSELILLFLYLGFMALQAAIPDRRTAWRAGAILLLVGVVNIPIIHYSVDWWYTLHQPATITKFDTPSIHPSMLAPLLIMAIAFKVFYISLLLSRTQAEILHRERKTHWIKELARSGRL